MGSTMCQSRRLRLRITPCLYRLTVRNSHCYATSMTTNQIAAGQDVNILSTNGTGRVTGHGVVAAVTPNGLIVTRPNGRRIMVHASLVQAAGRPAGT